MNPPKVFISYSHNSESHKEWVLRYDKRADTHEAFLSLGCALIYWNALTAAR